MGYGSPVCQVGNKKGFEGDLVLVKRKVEDLENLKGACKKVGIW